MSDGLVQISLFTIILGEEITIATYQSPVVPRKSEMIYLWLHPGWYAVPGEQAKDHVGRFLVHDVTYIAFNQEHIEDWYEPYPNNKVSAQASIRVTPIDNDARAYLQRLEEERKEPTH
jgi:hypothetical protein